MSGPYLTDALAESAARAHGDEGRPAKDTARRQGVSDRTARRWRSEGKGSPADRFALFLWNDPNPYRHVAHSKAIAHARQLRDLSRSQLIVRYRELVVLVAEAEAELARLTARQSAWLDRSAARERLAGHLEEMAGAEKLMAAKRVTDAEIWGRP